MKKTIMSALLLTPLLSLSAGAESIDPSIIYHVTSTKAQACNQTNGYWETSRIHPDIENCVGETPKNRQLGQKAMPQEYINRVQYEKGLMLQQRDLTCYGL